MGNDETALVQFKETVIDEFNEPYHKQQFKLLVREIGKRYNNIVLRVLHTEVECMLTKFANNRTYLAISCLILTCIY